MSMKIVKVSIEFLPQPNETKEELKKRTTITYTKDFGWNADRALFVPDLNLMTEFSKLIRERDAI